MKATTARPEHIQQASGYLREAMQGPVRIVPHERIADLNKWEMILTQYGMGFLCLATPSGVGAAAVSALSLREMVGASVAGF
jgi:hypothetical protein